MSDSGEFTEVVRDNVTGEIVGLKKHKAEPERQRIGESTLPSPSEFTASDYSVWERMVEEKMAAEARDAFEAALEVANLRLHEAGVSWRFRVQGAGENTEVLLDEIVSRGDAASARPGPEAETSKPRRGGFGFGAAGR